MKKVLLIIALVAGGLVVKAQDKKDAQQDTKKSTYGQESKSSMGDPSVPNEVRTELNKKYPEAAKADVRWKKEKEDYLATFTSKKNKDFEVKFDKQGKWVSTKTKKGTMEELPEKVKAGITKSEFKTWDVKDVGTEEKPGKTTYMIEVRSGIKTKELTVDKDGTIVKTENKMM